VLLAHAGAPAATGLAWLVPLVAAGVPALLYLAGVRRAGRPWGRGRTASFLGGAVLLGVALSPPVEAAAAGATGHVLQHLLLASAAPIALVLGAPVSLLLSAMPVAARRPAAAVLRARSVHVLSHPVVAAALSTGGLYALHLTPLYALSSSSAAVHGLVHGHLLLAGSLYAWSIAGPDPAPRRPGTAFRVGVLVAAGGAHALLAKLLYARAPAWPPGSGHGVAELQQAAQWMYYGGSVADAVLLTALFAAAHRRSGRALSRRRAPVPAVAAGVSG